MTRTHRIDSPRPAWSVACVVGLVLTLSSATAWCIPTRDDGEHAFARARFALAAHDTLGAVHAAREALDGTASEETRARAIVLLQILDRIDAPVTASAPGAALEWSVALGAAPAFATTIQASSAVRLLEAARALDRDDPQSARMWLEGARPKSELQILHLHLQARIADLESDPAAAAAYRRELVGAKSREADAELIAQAALQLARASVAANEDPSRWLALVPARSALAARAQFVTLLLALPTSNAEDADARLAQWLAAFPDHPVADEARARRVALALDTGDFARARDRALERADALLAERSVLEDRERMPLHARELWAEPVPAAVRLDDAAWRNALSELTQSLSAHDAAWPPSEKALLLSAAHAGAVERATLVLDPADRALDSAFADSMHQARRSFAFAIRERDRLRAELAQRLAYHDRGALALDAVADSLRRALDELLALQSRGPALLDDLRAVEDTLLGRIERRSRSLATRAQWHADNASGLHWLYADGPMARREPAPRPEVPATGELLQGEEELADAAHDALDSLRVQSRELVRRSFSEVFARRVTLGADEAVARARWLLDRDASLVATLDATLAGLALDPRLDAAERAAARARTELASLQERRAAHRLAAAERAVARAVESLDARVEGLLYTLAVATTELAVNSNTAEAIALRGEAKQLWARFLDLGPDPHTRGDARYRWADLELVLARESFQQRMGDWLEKGGTNERSLAPLLDIEPALELFRAILAEDPQFAQRDLVLFQLGMLHADRGDPEAETYLATLVNDHPDSPVLQEAHLRRGELAFDADDHRTALGHLRAAAQGDDPQATAIALYKLGWSANTVGDVPLAIDAFLRLADLYAEDARAPRRIDLEDESRALLLRSLARDGGAESFARTFDAAGERDFAPAMLADLSALLAGYALEEQAEEADRLFLHRYPLHAGALAAADRLVLGAERARGVVAGDAARLDVFASFTRTSAWAQAQTQDSLRVQGDEFARSAVLTVAVRRHQRAREQSESGSGAESHDDFRAALGLYDRLLAGWSDHAEAPRWSLLAGECARTVGDHAVALERFGRAAAAGGEFATEAAWQRVATADQWYRESIAEGASAGVDSLARQLLKVGDAHPVDDPARAADLQWRLAQVALAHGWDAEVTPRFAAFAAAHPRDPRALRAKTLHAESLYRSRQYDLAARSFEAATLAASAANADSLAGALRPWIAHSEDLHAESVANDPARGLAQAAPLWRELVTRWPDFDGADRALYRAGLGFEQGQLHLEAVEAWTTLLDAHPASDFAPDAHRNLARHHEDRGDFAAAAAAIEVYAATYPESDDAGEALLHAVSLLERAGDGPGRARTLDLYLQQHPEDLATRRWVLEERAVAELDADREGEAVRALLEFARNHPEHGSPALLARIDLRRADALVVAYEKIVLTQPLPASLERKRDALAKLLDAHRLVAERGVTPYAQAAAFRIGGALVHMGEALLASERPANLTGDDLAAYDEVLESQAWGFTERGEEAWRELLRLHHTVEDPALQPWIASTRAALFPRTAQRFLHRPSFEYPVLTEARSGR